MQLGIDFGTSYTKMAACMEGRLAYEAPAFTEPIPSILAYLPATDQLYFGAEALQLLEEQDAVVVPFFKLALKRNPGLLLGSYDLGRILTAFFTYLYQRVAAFAASPIDSVTLSVPNYFGLKARRSLYTALQTVFAGAFIYLLPEPVSALLGYQALHPEAALQGEILIIDIGGGTTDFSFLTMGGFDEKLVLETQLQMGHDTFSGAEVDKGVIRTILAPLFQMQTGRALPLELLEEKNLSPSNRHLLLALLRLAEAAKIEISVHHHAAVSLAEIFPELTLTLPVDQSLFTTALNPLWQRLDSYLQTVLQPQARSLGLFDHRGWKLDHILLLGGASLTLGLCSRLEDFFKGVPIHLKNIDKPYQAVGDCCWDADRGESIYTIYPFHFYIEKQADQPDSRHQLELIPFDTANLELNLTQSYRIFSVLPLSPYNLASEPDHLEIKIYELSSESVDKTLERFSGQEVILHYRGSNYNSDEAVHIDLDLSSSQLIVNYSAAPANCYQIDLFADWSTRQMAQAEWLSAYKYVDGELINSLQAQLKSNQAYGLTPYSNQVMTTYYKLICLLQILNP